MKAAGSPLAPALALALALAALSAAGCGERERPGRPPRHALLVTVAGLRPDRTSAYLYRRPTTSWKLRPDEREAGLALAFDDVSAQGVTFVDAFTHCPLPATALEGLLVGATPPPQDADGIPDAATTLAERLRAAGLRTAAFVTGEAAARAEGFEQGFEVFERAGRDLDAARAALAWMEARDPRAERLFVWLHLSGPTPPFEPQPLPPAADAPAGEVDYVRLLLDPAHARELPARDHRRLFAHPDDATLAGAGAGAADRAADLYDGEVAELASLLRTFLLAWRALGAEEGAFDDTALLVAGVHGVDLEDPGAAPGVRAAWTRVPLVLRHPPSLTGARLLTGPVELADVAPTLLEWLGVPRAGLGAPGAQPAGRSLLGRTDSRPREPFEPRPALSYAGEGAPLAALRDARWTLVWDGRSDPPTLALHDRHRDPLEREDVADLRPAEVERLRAELSRRLGPDLP